MVNQENLARARACAKTLSSQVLDFLADTVFAQISLLSDAVFAQISLLADTVLARINLLVSAGQGWPSK